MRQSTKQLKEGNKTVIYKGFYIDYINWQYVATCEMHPVIYESNINRLRAKINTYLKALHNHNLSKIY